MRTVGDVDYEAGPWRVPNTHRRVRALCAELGVPLEPLRTPNVPEPPPAVSLAGLTTWDHNALRTGRPLEADRLDLRTGYAGETHAASAPYTTHADAYLVAPTGLTSLVEAMARDLEDVRYDHRVVDVVRRSDGAYELTVRRRLGHNAFRTVRLVAREALFVCVPPHACREWTVFREHARSVMHSVRGGALHHIYVADGRHPKRRHVKDERTLAAQYVSSQYPASPWFQASYTAGRLALFWHRLRMASRDLFWTTLRAQVQAMVGWTPRADAEHRSHHWPVAYHAWVAGSPHFELDQAVRCSIEPNPTRLPGVYLAGEAWSSHQAWIEGALETAELSVERFFTTPSEAGRCPAKEEVVVEGWPLDVSAWKAQHPGGVGPLANHLGEDVTELMLHVGHSADAWAAVHSLKRIPK